MENCQVYQDIQARTGGEIYIGVVGPVRTGKSTFIKRFMEEVVLPDMEDEGERRIARDELPQSAGGKTIMTTEPKFVPREAATLCPAPELSVKVRLIDCVGFLVPGAVGYEEDGRERMVKTPWFDYEIPFTRAAELGTRKVIREHATIGILVTTDGTVSDLKREDYRLAEETAVKECREIGRPFLILLNSIHPRAEETRRMAGELRENYGVQVMPVNCEQLTAEDIHGILRAVLLEFPVTSLRFHLPRWLEILPVSHPLKRTLLERIRESLTSVHTMKDVRTEPLEAWEEMESCRSREMDLASGDVSYQVEMTEESYFRILSEYAGLPIDGQAQLIHLLHEFAGQREEYRKVQEAVAQVRGKGYSVVIPERSEIHLKDPEIVRHGSRYGVRMLADAPSIHMIQAVIQTEIAPLVGSEEQARDLVQYINEQKNLTEDGVWETNIFGKSIGQIVSDGIRAKTEHMSDDTQLKLQGALQKIVNTGSGNMICIIL